MRTVLCAQEAERTLSASVKKKKKRNREKEYYVEQG